MNDLGENFGENSAPRVVEPADLWTKTQALEAELAAARAQIVELEQDRDRWFAAASQSQQALHAMSESRSWRVTSPLRRASWVGQRLIAAVQGLAARCLRAPRQAAKTALLWAVRRTLANVVLRARAEKVLANVPRLRSNLRALAALPTDAHAEMPPPEMDPLAALSPRALAIYRDLAQLIAAGRH